MTWFQHPDQNINTRKHYKAVICLGTHYHVIPRLKQGLNIIIIIILKKGWQCKAGRERLIPYQSEDPQPRNTNP